MLFVQAVPHLVPDPLHLQQVDGAKSPQIPEEVSSRLVEKPLEFADMERFTRMQEEVRQ